MSDAKTIPLTVIQNGMTAEASVPTSAGLVEGAKQLGGDKISRSPVRGPLPIQRMSLAHL